MTQRIRSAVPLAGMTVTHAVDDLYQGAVPALIPFLVAERQYSYAAAAGITLAATVLSSVTQPLFGVLTDRRNLSWLVPLGVVLAGVGIGLSGLTSSYPLTWLAVALSGLGVAAYHPEASRAARIAAGGSARGMSWFAVGGNIGFAAAPLLITPVLAAATVSATPVLALPAILVGVVLVIARRAARGSPSRTPGETGRADNWRAFRLLTAAVVCRSICFFGLTTFLGLYFIRELAASTVEGNAALAVFLSSGIVGTLFGGWLADRIGRVRAVRIGYALAVPGLLVLLSATGPALGYPAAALLGIALYIPFSVQVTLGQEYLPNRIGTASGITLGLAVSVGGVLAPVFGVLADQLGLPWSLAALLLFPLAALAVSFRLPDTRTVYADSR